MSKLDRFTLAYIECALWSSTHDYGDDADCDELVNKTHSINDLTPDTLATIKEECEAFQETYATLLEQAGDDEQNGHDFWLTRNRHGAGYWDRGYVNGVGKALTEAAHAEGSRDLYVGDDGMIYQS